MQDCCSYICISHVTDWLPSSSPAVKFSSSCFQFVNHFSSLLWLPSPTFFYMHCCNQIQNELILSMKWGNIWSSTFVLVRIRHELCTSLHSVFVYVSQARSVTAARNWSAARLNPAPSQPPTEAWVCGARKMSLINLGERIALVLYPWVQPVLHALSFCLSWMFDGAASCSVDVTAAQTQQ